MLEPRQANYLVSLACDEKAFQSLEKDATADFEIGMCWIDLSTGEFNIASSNCRFIFFID